MQWPNGMCSLYLTVKVPDLDDLSGRKRGPLFLNTIFSYMSDLINWQNKESLAISSISLIENVSSKETEHCSLPLGDGGIAIKPKIMF